MLKSLVFLWYFYLNPWSIEYRFWEELWIACCLFLWPMMSCYITFPPLLYSKQPQSVSNILVFPALTHLCFSYLLSFVMFFSVTNPNLFGLYHCDHLCFTIYLSPFFCHVFPYCQPNHPNRTTLAFYTPFFFFFPLFTKLSLNYNYYFLKTKIQGHFEKIPHFMKGWNFFKSLLHRTLRGDYINIESIHIGG